MMIGITERSRGDCRRRLCEEYNSMGARIEVEARLSDWIWARGEDQKP